MKKILAAGVLALSLLTVTVTVQAEDVLTPGKPVTEWSWLDTIVTAWHEIGLYF